MLIGLCGIEIGMATASLRNQFFAMITFWDVDCVIHIIILDLRLSSRLLPFPGLCAEKVIVRWTFLKLL